MTVFVFGNELDVFNPLSANCREKTSIAAAFDSAVSRCAISCGTTGTGTATGFRSPDLPDLPALWVAWAEFRNGAAGSLSGVRDWRIVNSGNTDLIYTENSPGQANRRFFSDSIGAPLGAAFALNNATRIRFDVFVDFVNAVFLCYIDGVLTINVPLPGSTARRARAIAWNNFAGSTSGEKLCSEIIIADEPTLNMRVQTMPAISNGVETQWNGPVTNINETILDDAAGIDTNLNNQLRTFTINTPTILPNYGIRAVAVGVRGNSSAGSPDSVDAICRLAGVNYFSPNISLVGATNSRVAVFDNNPASAAPWTSADLNSANFQFGLASRA